ncbi:hypothetical protein SXCC_00306 [Gluconacetobacter sp. SXCC-1]|nr:hypothetical protein SXCC_00306 [Gluconacetobacter sp. SXCC-1]
MRSCGNQPANGRVIDRRHRSSVPDPTAYPDPGHIALKPLCAFTHLFA